MNFLLQYHTYPVKSKQSTYKTEGIHRMKSDFHKSGTSRLKANHSISKIYDTFPRTLWKIPNLLPNNSIREHESDRLCSFSVYYTYSVVHFSHKWATQTILLIPEKLLWCHRFWDYFRLKWVGPRLTSHCDWFKLNHGI